MTEAHPLPKGYDAADALRDGWSPAALAAAARWEPFPIAEPTSNSRTQAPNRHFPDEPLQPYFDETDQGLIYHGVVTSRKTGELMRASPVRVCSPIWARARTRTHEGTGWGRLIEIRDADGVQQQRVVPYNLLRGSGDELRGLLFDAGLEIGIHRDAPRLLMDYLKQSDPEARARSALRTGWHGDEPGATFVFPERTLGASEEPVIFQPEGALVANFGERGTLAEWQEQVAALCVGNSRLLFVVSCGFAAPLLALIGEEGGGFHLRGKSTDTSSTGKTTCFRVAASLYGPPLYMQQWRATSNGLEGIALQHNDGLLLLDDIGKIADPREAGLTAYMLEAGSEKIRGARAGGTRALRNWRLLFLSNGELSLRDLMAEAGKVTRTGQEVRMADVPADAGAGLGCWGTLHGYESPGALAKALKERAAGYYGTAGTAFIEAVIRRRSDLPEAIRRAQAEFVRDLLGPLQVPGQVERVLDRFGLVAVAGELATAWGITGWPAGEAQRGVAQCARAWLEARGGTGNLEEQELLGHVRHFIELNGDAQFADWDRTERGDDHRPKTSLMAGYARYRYEPQPTRYYIFRERFRRDICKGYDYRDVEKTLLGHGWLIPSGDTPPRATRNEGLPVHGKQRVYVLELPEEPGAEDPASPR